MFWCCFTAVEFEAATGVGAGTGGIIGSVFISSPGSPKSVFAILATGEASVGAVVPLLRLSGEVVVSVEVGCCWSIAVGTLAAVSKPVACLFPLERVVTIVKRDCV